MLSVVVIKFKCTILSCIMVVMRRSNWQTIKGLENSLISMPIICCPQTSKWASILHSFNHIGVIQPSHPHCKWTLMLERMTSIRFVTKELWKKIHTHTQTHIYTLQHISYEGKVKFIQLRLPITFSYAFCEQPYVCLYICLYVCMYVCMYVIK